MTRPSITGNTPARCFARVVPVRVLSEIGMNVLSRNAVVDARILSIRYASTQHHIQRPE
jgi:hypothetical protein